MILDLETPGEARPLTKEGVSLACEYLQVRPHVLWAVIDVETSGIGYRQDRRVTALFERHIFHRLSKGALTSDTDISCSIPGGYTTNMYDRIIRAAELDEAIAVKATSWGIGQIMGFNHKIVNYDTVWGMVNEFKDSENAQVHAMALFISYNKLAGYLQHEEWAPFARGYNGVAYAKNQYHTKLARAYERRRKIGLPDLVVRAGQMKCWFAGINPGRIDGIMGRRTEAAFLEYAKRTGETLV